jgi:hypothetical protein
VVITTGLGPHQAQSPEGWHINLGGWRSVAHQILCIGPPGLSASSMNLATGAFDPCRGYTSPPGLEPLSSGSPAEIRLRSRSPAEIRLFGFSPEGGTSLPVCVSHRNWENTPNPPSPEGVELKAERRKPSGEKHCEIEDNPSLTGVLAHFRFQHHCPQARRAAHPLPVVITTGLGPQQAQSPEGWHINLGNDHL